MNKICKAISGSSLLISGTIILNLVMAGMDWNRIDTYGLFHELGLKGCAPFVFLLGVIMMIAGIIYIIASNFKVELDDNEISN